jgi:hypothetical protein
VDCPSERSVVPKNLSHNGPAVIDAAKMSLTDLARLYLVTEVAGQSQATLDAKRPRSERLRCGKISIRIRVSEGIRTVGPWGHNPNRATGVSGKSLIHKDVSRVSRQPAG